MEYYVYRNPNDELVHWGVKGMHWGVRRYQNKDGSLTAAGKKRRSKLEKKSEKLKRKIDKIDGVDKNLDSSRKKTAAEMTIAELKAATERMNVEKNYYEAQRNLAAANPKQVSKGKQIAEKILMDKIVPAVGDAAKSYIEKTVKDKLGIKENVKINWDDKIKEQTYAKNVADKALNDLKRSNDILAEQIRRQKMEDKADDDGNRNKTTKNTNDGSAEKVDTESNSTPKQENKSTDSTQTTKTDAGKSQQAPKSDNTSSGTKSNSSSNTDSKTQKDSKVYTGTVEGVGTSSSKYKSSTQQTSSSKRSDIIDAEPYEVVAMSNRGQSYMNNNTSMTTTASSFSSSTTNRGYTYIAGLLEEPKGLSNR